MTIFLLLLAVAAALHAQSFDSRSTGADGALEMTTPGVYEFDPRAFNPPLYPTGDGVYHFTSIRVGKGVTVRLSSGLLQGPVFWLAQGPVEIDGVLDLSGEDRGPGAGGYPGGALRQIGFGPGHDFKPNIFLVPLAGGAGGDGGETQGGGTGGGAILIASSISITVNGKIIANGGQPMQQAAAVAPSAWWLP